MDKYVVIWTQSAKYDLKLIIQYIGVDSISVAKKIFLEIKNECNELYYMLTTKRVVAELQHIGITKYREIIYKRWRIVFKVEKSDISVLIVADSSRNLEDILFQRLIDKDIPSKHLKN